MQEQSSPIWVSPVATPDLLLERKDLEFDHGSGKLTVRPDNHGDASATTTVSLYSSAADSSLVEFDLDGEELGVVTRVEPLDEGRSLLLCHLYIPSDYNEAFDFSGRIQLTMP